MEKIPMSELVELLADEREIHRALCAYGRALDERDWSALERLFVPDVTADYGGGEFRVAGAGAIVDMCRSMLGGCGPTQHLLGNLVVDRVGDALVSRCYVRAAHRGAPPREHLAYEVWGQYEDRWRRTEDGLKIAARRMRVDCELGTRDVLGPPE
jgi:hypothetical protein